ncbi:MAG TPA: lytic transglycosylase domain-containing protein [Terriglobia bacterium]|nr:lytic transglycosylase domain-containing protein [Terriglobia bacterium]
MPTIFAVCALAYGIFPRVAAAQVIEARLSAQGRLVYTNNIVDNPAPAPPVVKMTIPPSGPVVGTMAVSGTLQDAVRALSSSARSETVVGAIVYSGADIEALVKAISLRHGVDPDLVSAVIRVESNYNPMAVSNKGARGLMQLVPATGSRFGVENFFDARENIDGGVRYLKFLLEKFEGNIDLSLAAYNAGEGIVERLGRVPPYDETRNYVRRIRSVYTKKSALLLPLEIPLAPALPTGQSVTALNVSVTDKPAPQSAAPAVAVAQPVAVVEPEAPRIYQKIDQRGVPLFSNVD